MATRPYDDRGVAQDQATPMEVDQVKGKYKGKGKEKGKKGQWGKGKFKNGKGKEKGKEKNNPDSYFNGECGHCGKRGHKRADCRKRQHEEKAAQQVSATGSAAPSETGKVVSQISQDNQQNDKMWIFMVNGGPVMSDAQGNAFELGDVAPLFLKLGKEEQQVAHVKFQRCSVKQPIFSLGKLAKQGVVVSPDGTCPSLRVGATKVMMKWIRNTLWIQACAFWNAADAHGSAVGPWVWILVDSGADDHVCPID